MNAQITSFLTSEEIGHLTQTAHELVLSRACEQLLKAGLDPNQFWNEYTDLETGIAGKRLHLPKPECLLVIGNEWFSDKAKSRVMDVWNAWDQEEYRSIADMQKRMWLSETIAEMRRLSHNKPVDIHSQDELHEALATYGAEVIWALDAGRIYFEHDEDRAMLLELLAVVIDYVMDGGLKNIHASTTTN